MTATTALDAALRRRVHRRLVEEGAEQLHRAPLGRVRERLAELLRDPYYRRKPPKTTGREHYGREFVNRLRGTALPLPDMIATATALTAATIALGIRGFVPFRVRDLIVSGGGAHNQTLLHHLMALLPEVNVAPSDQFGIGVDAKEAIAFAMLAYETWRRRPGNLPSATGALHAVILGQVTR